MRTWSLMVCLLAHFFTAPLSGQTICPPLERGLVDDFVNESVYCPTITWISDVDDEFELQDGSRWVLTDDPNALNWKIGDQITFMPRYDFLDGLPVRRAHKREKFCAMLTKIADAENALQVESVHPNTLRIVLNDGSIWQAKQVGACALSQMFQAEDIVLISPVKHIFFDEMMIINQTRFPFALLVQLKKASGVILED